MDRRIAAVLLLLFATGFAVRAVPVETGYHYWDETVYLQHGEIIAGDAPDTYNEFDFRPPLMGLLLGGLFMVTDSLVAAHLLVAFLAALAIPLTFLLGRRLFDTTTGILAAFGVLVSLEHVKISHDILVDGILPVLWLGATLAFLRLQDTDSWRWAAATGMLCGLAVLLKFTSLVLLGGIGILFLAWRWQEERSVRDVVTDRQGWTVVGAFAATVAPYLAWSWATYGAPLHVFTRALQLSGAPDPFWTYAAGFPQVVALPFILGLVLFPLWYRDDRGSMVVTAVMVLVLLVPLQFVIENRELRFMLPVMPFITVAGAAGMARLQRVHRYAAPTIILLLLLPAAVGAWNAHDVYQARSGAVTMHTVTPTMEAGQWLRAETDPDARVYANYQWPPLAYYSKRPLTVLPVSGEVEPRIGDLLDGPGYVVAFTTVDREPTVDFLQEDPRFALNTSFGGEAYIFHYGGGSR